MRVAAESRVIPAFRGARSIRVSGVVQGVGFRPFVYRLAQANQLTGWVLNGDEGVEIYLEGAETSLQTFIDRLNSDAPPAASIAEVIVKSSEPLGFSNFSIRHSQHADRPTVRISPDLPVCDECLKELFEPSNPRYHYPYINCTNCGPRYTVIRSLPYDRSNTTMHSWALDGYCGAEYHDPANRRFHAQPVACPNCGPAFHLRAALSAKEQPVGDSESAIRQTVNLLNAGKIVAIKGLGGYHLCCDAENAAAVMAMRERKFRKEKPFALMANNIEVARGLVELSPEAETLLNSTACPIVLSAGKIELRHVAPANSQLGIMLPYTPLHHLLFAAGAPKVLVMTSANRSSEPIAYEDPDALKNLCGIADAFLVGERPIARRVDDSVARVGAFGPVILRRARGYAPGAVATIPSERPVLAVGADLKNTVTLVVGGQAFVSQHIGDLGHYQALRSFQETIQDLLAMYEVRTDEVYIAHDLHPQYASTVHALNLEAAQHTPVQHHRAHIASVLSERGEFTARVVGASFDGTGYGDDGSIWGGEIFVGSIKAGFHRVAHLRPAILPGGDAAAQNPVQAAAGFLAQLESLPDMSRAPLNFPRRFADAMKLVRNKVRAFPTTSAGRLFDCVAALLGFNREITFEGQAAIWLEQLAAPAPFVQPYPFPFIDDELDFRPLLQFVIDDHLRGRSTAEIARAFHRGVAQGLHNALISICRSHKVDTVVLSGGVFQNELLLEDLKELFRSDPVAVWTNHAVPPNDGGISLGQAALAALALITQTN